MSFLDPGGPLAPIFSASHVGIVILDSLGRTVFVNPRGRNLLGISDESRPFIDGKGGQVKPGFTGAAGLAGLPFKEIVETRRPVTGACLDATCREGPHRTLSANGYPVFGAAGRVDKVIFLIDDTLSEGVRKDAVLAEPEGFQAVFENAPIGIVHFDSQGTITACNESNAQIFGAGRDRIVGLNLEKDLVDERMKAAYETCRSGEIGRFEGEYVSVAGNKPIVARAAFVPLISGSGSFSGGIELVEDITERRKTEDMLEWQLRVNTAIAEISGSLIAPSVSVEKIAEIVLAHVKSITGSTSGCIASVDQETGDVSAHVIGCAGGPEGAAGGTDGKYGQKWEKALGEAKAFFVNEPPGNGSAGSSSGTPVRPARFLYVPATDGGEPLGHIAVADSHRDYTKRDLNAVERLAHLYTLSLQRKNIEKKIERLATFPELNPYPIIEVDFSGKVTYSNRATSETLRRSGGLFEPTAFFPADMDEILAGCPDETPERFYREVTIGEFTFGEDIFCTPGFKTIRIYARDITAKRRSEEALQTAHDLLETKIQGRTNELLAANEALDDVRALLEKVVVAVDQVEEGVAITDCKGFIEYANPAFERLTGLRRELLIGKEITGTVDGEARDAIGEAISGGRAWAGRFPRVGFGGTVYEIGVSLSPVKDVAGRIINYIDVERDVTRQVKLEAELHQSQKLEAIGTLAGGIAHDFNNIIAGIIGFTEIMMEDTPIENPMHRRLSMVLKGAHRGKTLVDQILSFSRKRRTGMKPVSLTRAIEETTEALRSRLPASVELRRSIVKRDSMILGDYVQVHQMLTNLYANALFAMREQGGLLDISLKPFDHGEVIFSSSEEMRDKPWVQLTVRDTGCGMEESMVERIFEPFFTTRAPGEGSGMGLSVVHGIVRRHDGVIRVESEPAKGTAFHLFFPECEGSPEAETEESADLPGGTEKVLVVDDEVLITEMSRQRLERLGYRVITAASAREAIGILGSGNERIDLVITDYSMPEATGIDLARELAGTRPEIPVILCSGLNEVVTEGDIKTFGVADFFMKPVGKREFARLVRAVLDRARAGTRGETVNGENSDN